MENVIGSINNVRKFYQCVCLDNNCVYVSLVYGCNLVSCNVRKLCSLYACFYDTKIML